MRERISDYHLLANRGATVIGSSPDWNPLDLHEPAETDTRTDI